MKKKILISAIEVSADMHAANLVKEIHKINPQIDFFGYGSEALKTQGVEIHQDLSHRSTVGLLEPLRHLFSYLKALKYLKNLILKEKPDAFFCIDGQGFHMLAAKEAKKLGIPVIYYIAPQEWLWGTKAGGQKVAELCDLIIAIFPEEQKFYKKLGVKTIYNGHPLADIVKPSLSTAEFFSKNNLDQTKKLISFFPGSRKQELKTFIPIFIKLTALLSSTDYQYTIVAANNFCFDFIKKNIKNNNIKIILKDNYNTINASNLVICSTGTITLEAALIGTPLVAIYKLAALSYWLLLKVVGKRMPKYKALPNMLRHQEIIPELIQENLTDTNLQAVALKMLNNQEIINKTKTELHALKKSLNKENILKNNAREFIDFLTFH